MFIEFTNKEILIIAQKDMYLAKSYPDEDGVYLVYDRVVYFIVTKVGDTVLPLMLPADYVPLENRPESKTIIDKLDKINESLNNSDLKYSLEDNTNTSPISNNRITDDSVCLSISDLIKIIAVSQDASLLKDI